MSELEAGQHVLGRYRIVRELGQGGMGVVYLGRTEGAAGFTRPVVIKRLHADLAGDRQHTEMFVREARILANLQHPNIVGVVDFGRERRSYIMVLEYVHGYDLAQWSRFVLRTRSWLNCEHVIYILRRVLAALQHAHEVKLPDGTAANIVHRDVSLSNVLLDTQAQVKLHDFGIARMEDGREMQTATGIFRGKLGLAAPELLRGAKATQSTDTYAAAVMTYHLLSGKNPFSGQDAAETVLRVLQHNPGPLAALREDLPLGLDEVLSRGLHKDPARRFESASHFARALEPFCTRSDEALMREFARQLTDDFSAIPKFLNLESLTDRDAAWREAQPLPMDSQVPLSSTPPETRAGEPSVTTAQPSPPTHPTGPGLAARAPRVPHDLTALSLQVPGVPAARGSTKFALALGGAVATIVALSLTFITRSPADPSPTRYLVIEKPGNPAASALPTDAALPTVDSLSKNIAPEPTPPATSTLGVAVPSVDPKPTASVPKAATAVKPDAEALSQHFRTHQAQIESCFRRHAAQVEGRPEISVRFAVDRAGKVTQANLSPARLNGTALGSCVLQVARSAHFGPLTESVAFSIPITARRGN